MKGRVETFFMVFLFAAVIAIAVGSMGSDGKDEGEKADWIIITGISQRTSIIRLKGEVVTVRTSPPSITYRNTTICGSFVCIKNPTEQQYQELRIAPPPTE